MNPECKAGKHWNCDGISDIDDDDQPVPCRCDCHPPVQPEPVPRG